MFVVGSVVAFGRFEVPLVVFFTADPFLLDAHIDVCTRASDPAISFIQEVSLRKKPAVRSGKAASKKPASMIHAGRFLLLKHRTSGQKAALPLQKRITKKGAPGPSESKDEVLPLLKTKLCSSKQIVGSDASKGLQGDYKEMNLTATTARHSQSEYTPTVTLSKRHLPKKALH